MLAPLAPLPATNGAARRILAFCKGLSEAHDLTVCHLGRPVETPVPWRDIAVGGRKNKNLAAVLAFLSSRSFREMRFFDRSFAGRVQKIMETEDFDVIWLNFLDMTQYVSHFIFNQTGDERRAVWVLDQHNLDERSWRSFLRSTSKMWWKLFAWRELAKARKRQRSWFGSFDLILSVSEEERLASLPYIDGDCTILTAPNGVDTGYFAPSPTQGDNTGKRVLFGGSMDVRMNQDAVFWFVDEILPRIRRAVPSVEFYVVGRNPPRAIRKLAEVPSIVVTGTVQDVRPFYQETDVFVIPTRFGGGTKLKTLEAMSLAKAIVTTTVGVQGLELEGQEVVIRDDATGFADAVIRFLQSPTERRAHGIRARALVENRYDWKCIVASAETAVKEKVSKVERP